MLRNVPSKFVTKRFADKHRELKNTFVTFEASAHDQNSAPRAEKKALKRDFMLFGWNLVTFTVSFTQSRLLKMSTLIWGPFDVEVIYLPQSW